MENNNILSLTIETKINKLTNIKLIETVPTDILKLLINSSLLKQQFNNPFSTICFDNEKQQLEKYLKLVKNNEAIITYTQTKNTKYGRVFPKNAVGLFSIRREIRHTLARDNYIDIDVENCHPVILYQICDAYNIKCNYLKYYIDNRTEILNEVMTKYNVNKDAAKQLFIQLLYFGTFESWCENHNISDNEPLRFISKFKTELNMIGEIIVSRNPKLCKVIQANKELKSIKHYNIKGSVCSYFLQEYESRILECIYLYCMANDYIKNNAVLCADGIMIPKDNYNDEILDEFKMVIKEKLNFDLNFTTKELNQGYTLEQLQETQIKPEIGLLGVFNDLQAAQVVYTLYPHWVSCNSTLYVFDDKTGLWTDKEETMFNIISRFDEHLYLLTTNNNNEVKKTTRGYGNSTGLQRQMLPQIKQLCINNSWLTNTDISSLQKLLFKNGYLDMSTGSFYSVFDPNIVFFNRIERNYNDEIDIEYINDVKQRFFYNHLGEDVGNYLILNVARSLAGDRMKKIFFGLGETNAGKSTITTSTINTFGDYIGTFNGENLCIKNTSADEAQIMRWAFLLRYKRIIFSNEMKSESVLSANMMKKVSSGGDYLSGRTHGDVETPFIPHFNVFCNANDLLAIKPYDDAINERLNIISYNKKYVDNPSNEFELKKDDNINIEMKSDKFKDAFSFIIIDAYLQFCKDGKKEYVPEAVKNCKIDWVGEGAENTSINNFLGEFVITDNEEDFIRSSEIDLWLKEAKLNISINKFVLKSIVASRNI